MLLPLNRAPEASSAMKAIISGLPMLPPGTAERIELFQISQVASSHSPVRRYPIALGAAASYITAL